jgi:hypothetical protein
MTSFGDVTLFIPDGAGHRLKHPPGAVFVADAVVEFSSHPGVACLMSRFQNLETVIDMDLIKGRCLS